ncbi:MAG: hypothetical protein E7039_08395 [Lentisphaerae bacterium]|nr:hypothetical protein [Lentisphaerota bacterium]
MSKYYIYTDGVVRGPFKLENIAMMLSDGRVDLSTPLSTGKGTPWQTIAERNEIIAARDQQLDEKNNAAVPEQKPRGRTIFYCPHCNQKYAGDASWLNKDIVCINCNGIFVAGNSSPEQEEISFRDEKSEEAFDWANCDGNVICPHCWQHFNSEQLIYIASHPSLMGDKVLGANAMKRFAPNKFNALGQALDEMGMVCTDVACPRCRLKIPLTVIDEKNFYFSLVGAPSSGKSYYLATLLNILRRSFANDFACTLLDVDPELNRVLDSYEETIFHASRRNEVAVLPKTQQTGDDFVNVVELDNIPVHLPKPFVYELKYLSSSEGREDCNIIFYDNAGEQFEPGADNISNPGTRHLACSDGIIFIFDPLNDALMRSKCNPDEPQLQTDEHVYEQAKLLSEMIARIRRHRNIGADAKCNIPLVIAAGKFDAWKDLLDLPLEKYEMLERLPGKLSALWCKNTVMDVSFAMREIMLEYVPELVNTAEGFFENVIFVPFSSFGCLASSSDSGQLGVVPEKVKPVWAEQPFFALLAENDLIDIAPTPGANESIEVKIIDNFILFDHPADGHQVRLPANYAGTVITINGKSYQMPQMVENNAKDFFNGEKKSDNDLWN